MWILCLNNYLQMRYNFILITCIIILIYIINDILFHLICAQCRNAHPLVDEICDWNLGKCVIYEVGTMHMYIFYVTNVKGGKKKKKKHRWHASHEVIQYSFVAECALLLLDTQRPDDDMTLFFLAGLVINDQQNSRWGVNVNGIRRMEIESRKGNIYRYIYTDWYKRLQ